MTLVITASALLLLATVPHWLPNAVIGLRSRLFTRINGPEGIAIPGDLVDASHFKRVYAHPAANGRSRGAALSDLFWYWLSPGPELHQEHLEPGERYEEVARTTRRLLAISSASAEELTTRCMRGVLEERGPKRARIIRLRDLMMPVWAEFYYEVVFRKPCPREVRGLIVENANDVVTALKCCGLRHMKKRARLTRWLLGEVRAGNLAHALPSGLSEEEGALYLQGVFFNTAVVQMSEAMTHVALLIAEHPGTQESLVNDPSDCDHYDRVIKEALRVYPLFGISHRITSAEIPLADGGELPKGSVLCFNHAKFQHAGFADPERFDPDRWKETSSRDANYIPFGVHANRPCPAQRLASITMRVALRELLRDHRVRSSVPHTRSIPNRGPCLFLPRHATPAPSWEKGILAFLRVRDRWENVWRSLVQLVLGTYMVWDARRLRLCQRYFEAQRAQPSEGRLAVTSGAPAEMRGGSP